MRRNEVIRQSIGSLVFACAVLLGNSGCTGSVELDDALEFQKFALDGAWCWFADPRAEYHEGKYRRTYAGWVTSNGSIQIGTYDHDTRQTDLMTLHAKLERDDHVNPALSFLDDGRLVVFYAGHAGPKMHVRITSEPENIHSFIEDRTVEPYDPSMEYEYTYPNPVRLVDEQNRMYLFWRGNVGEPVFTTSDDEAQTFSSVQRLITSPNKVPYLKISSRGKKRIHFAMTDAHPRLDPENSLSYIAYEDGKFMRADGSLVRTMDQIPFDVSAMEVVYDAKTYGDRAWVWDVAADENENPIIVYTRLPAKDDHRYHYARWDGTAWRDYELTAAGGAFPDTPVGVEEPEPYYSGGLILDHDDPSTVYLSRPVNGVFEIERWTTPDMGQTWQSEAVTRSSLDDNVRPFVVRHHPKDKGPAVLWMRNQSYVRYIDYKTSIAMDIPVSPNSLLGYDGQLQ